MNNAFLKLHLSVVLAGFTGVFGKLITLNEGLLVWYRLLLTSLMLFVFLRFSGGPEKSAPRHPYPAFTILATRTVSGFQEKAA